jgi:hypothetical protein
LNVLTDQLITIFCKTDPPELFAVLEDLCDGNSARSTRQILDILERTPRSTPMLRGRYSVSRLPGSPGPQSPAFDREHYLGGLPRRTLNSLTPRGFSPRSDNMDPVSATHVHGSSNNIEYGQVPLIGGRLPSTPAIWNGDADCGPVSDSKVNASGPLHRAWNSVSVAPTRSQQPPGSTSFRPRRKPDGKPILQPDMRFDNDPAPRTKSAPKAGSKAPAGMIKLAERPVQMPHVERSSGSDQGHGPMVFVLPAGSNLGQGQLTAAQIQVLTSLLGPLGIGRS